MEFNVPQFFVILGTIIGVCLNASGGYLFVEIYKGQKVIEDVPESYIVSNILCNIINLAFGKCKEGGKGDTNMLISSGIGSGLALLWSLCYLYYATKTHGGLKKLLLFIFIDLNLSFELYYIFTEISTNEDVPGKIAIGLGIINAATPGQNIYKVMKYKRRKLIPIWTTLLGALCSLSWFIYGAFGVEIAPDWNMMIPNGLGLLLNLCSTGAFFYAYVKRDQEVPEEKEDEMDEETKPGKNDLLGNMNSGTLENE